MLKLRPYQIGARDATINAFRRGRRRVLYALPTGCGKTVVFGAIHQVFREVNFDGPTVVLAHREELLDQAARMFSWADPDAKVGVEQGDRYADEDCDVVVASVQTLRSAKRAPWLKPSLVITDEAHHAVAASYMKVFDRFGCFEDKGAYLVGCTATPKRLDRLNLATVFEEQVYNYPIRQAIEDGYLCDIRGFRVRTDVSLDRVKTTAGDFNQKELAEAVIDRERTRRVLSHWWQKAKDRQTVAFCASVEHAQSVAEELNGKGFAAAAVWGSMGNEARQETLEKFKKGKLQVLTNVEILTEGWDHPPLGCILMMRPTQSWTLYCLDDQTEILTESGWQTSQSIKMWDRVAGFDQNTGEIRWVPLRGYVRRPIRQDEAMYHLESPQLDIRVTDQHRMVYRVRQGRSRVCSPWQIDTAVDLASRNSEYELPVAGLQAAPGVALSDDEIRFIGWFMTDGSMNKVNGQINIYQAEHQPHHQAIRDCLKGCGFKYTISYGKDETNYGKRTSRLVTYHISKGKPRGYQSDLRGWEALQDYLDKDLAVSLEQIDARQLGVLLEAMHLGDGSKSAGQSWTRRSYHISTGRKLMADRLQSLCVRRGFWCNVAEHTYNKNPLYVLHIKPKSVRTVQGRSAGTRPKLEPVPFQPGEHVWCVENELGTLVTRRKGKVAIVGNCQMVGRGTRLYRDKDDLIVIDVVDNCRRHSLAGVPAILDLPPGLDLQGEKLTQAAKYIDAIGEKAAILTTKPELPATFDELKEVLEKVDLFAQVEPPQEVKDNSALTWVKLADDHYYLSCGTAQPTNAKREAHLRQDLMGQWVLEVLEGANRVLGRGPLDALVGGALKAADSVVRQLWPGVVKLASREAPWRSDPPTDRQLDMLRKLGYEEKFLKDLSKGQASNLIGARMSGKR